MKSVIENAIFVSESAREFRDNETGEVRTYHKALFTQDDSDPMEITIVDSLAGGFERFGIYNLVLEINSYNRRFSVKVVNAHVAG